MALSDEDRETLRAERVRLSTEFNEVWNQDFARGARVLRAHLVVEHFLNLYLTHTNPQLGSIAEARLGFAQKLTLMGDHDSILEMLRPGMLRLNQVRNRLAHRLSVEISEDDVASFMSIRLFSATWKASHPKTWNRKPNPLKVLEEFAQLSAAMLQLMGDDARKERPRPKRGKSAASQETPSK